MTELNKETTSSEKKTEGDTFKTGPGTINVINDASNSGACDSHPENSPEQDGKSKDGKKEILGVCFLISNCRIAVRMYLEKE